MVKLISRFAAFAILPAALVSAQASKDLAPHTIVFVCEHGSAKSVIAAAHFNRLAKEQGLPYRAITRGTQPDPEIPAHIKRGLAADGLDVAGWIPRRIDDSEIRNGERVITFACTLPGKTPVAKVEDWKDIPPVSDNYERARDAIVAHINQLLKGLVAK